MSPLDQKVKFGGGNSVRNDDCRPPPARSVPRSSRASAFTLVELLVVIGIIVVLIAILMPALQRARAVSLQTKCLSNEKQIGQAMMMYLGESKGVMPCQPYDNLGGLNGVENFGDDSVNSVYPSYLGLLIPYLNNNLQVLVCPIARDDYADIFPAGSANYAPTATSDTNYMVNGAITGRKIVQIPQTTDLICLQEDLWQFNIAYPRPAHSGTILYQWQFNPAGSPEGREYNTLHFNGGNLLFADGHCEYRTYQQLRASDFGLTGGGGGTGQATDSYQQPDSNTYISAF